MRIGPRGIGNYSYAIPIQQIGPNLQELRHKYFSRMVCSQNTCPYSRAKFLFCPLLLKNSFFALVI